MKKLKKEGKIKDQFGQVVQDESIWDKEIHINWRKIFGTLISIIFIVYVIISWINAFSKLLGSEKIFDISKITNTIKTTTKDSSSKSEMAAYLTTTRTFEEYIQESSNVYNKYLNNEIFTKTELTNIYEKIENIRPQLENAPEKAGGLERNNLTLADSTLRLLNLLNKETDDNFKFYQDQINQEIAIRNSCIEQQLNMKIEALENYNIKYHKNEDGSINYIY
jgi:hypothetical protein